MTNLNMKKIVIVLIAFVAISFTSEAQSKTSKVTFEVDGVCKMCKDRIEKAALLTKGVKFASWNIEKKELYCIFNNKKTSLLLGVGNAVCGSSAIAAVSPVIKAEESDTGISIGVVNFLGTIGIFILPALAIKVLHFADLQASTLIGGSLQAVGQVVAAGFSVSDNVGEIATIIKMARIAMFFIINR